MASSSRTLAAACIIFGFAVSASAQTSDVIRRLPLEGDFAAFSCGGAGQHCCPPYRGSAGIIGPTHCNEGLGCNISANICEAPCGGAGQICCDGPETVAAQGGPIFIDASGAVKQRKQMCEASVCVPAARRCTADCGLKEGDACCGPQTMLAVASCINPSLACHFSDSSLGTGVCEKCGAFGQIPCATFQGCADGLAEDATGHCACDPFDATSGPVTTIRECSHWSKRRAQCFERTTSGGASLFHSISGVDVAPPMGRDRVCIESAFQARDGTILVDVDNPRIWNGSQVLGASRTGEGVLYHAIDHATRVSGGDGPASGSGFYALNTSGPARSVDDELPRIPNHIGDFGMGSSPQGINMITPGARVGPRPVNVDLVDIAPNQTAMPPFATFRLALNPAVLLVPVQVFVAFSDTANNPDAVFSRERALGIFDRVPDLKDGKVRITDGNGQVISVTIPLGLLVLDGDNRPASLGQTLPDDIWAQCGIQFRLVNYSQLKMSDDLLFPHGHTFIQSAVRDLLAEVQKSPRFLDGPLTVIVAPWCSDVNQAEPGDFFSPLGQTLVGSNALCIRYSSGDTVLAHELGHGVMSSSAHVDCTRPENSDNLMCPAGGGPVLSLAQCARARESLLGDDGRRLRFPPPK